MVGLIHKHSVDISTEIFSVALEPLISSLDPRVKTYIMGDFNINLLDHNLSPPVENFINQMISKKILIIIIYHDFLPTPRRGSHVKSGKTHTQSSRYTP